MVFGNEFDEWEHLNFKEHFISLEVDNNKPAENFFGDMRCQPLEAVADLINHLSTRKIYLKKGDFISTGAATVPQSFFKNSSVIADFGVIGKIKLTFT